MWVLVNVNLFYEHLRSIVVIKLTEPTCYKLHTSLVNGEIHMVANVQHQSTDTNVTVLQITPTDLKRIARSLQRASLFKQHSHGTIKRRAMAMINHYIRASAQGFSHGSSNIHPAM